MTSSLAMTYLHQQKPVVIHGDLKCQNILIGYGYRAKISDFGLSGTIETLASSDLDRKLCGTLEYIAPEYHDNPYKKKNDKFDVYSFGISSWEIFSQKSFAKEFFDIKVISVHVQNGVRPNLEDIRERIPTALQFLMRSCWRERHHERPTFESISEILYSQVFQLDFDLKLPCIAKSCRRSNIDDSCSSASDQTDFVTSMKRGDIEQTRARNKFLSGFRNVGESLLEYLDPDKDLLACLKQRHVLTDLDYQRLIMFAVDESSSYVEKNREILSEYVSPKIEYCCIDFIDALKDDCQQHIINHIMNAGELLDRVLSKDEIHLINKRMPCLVNLIDLDKFGFPDLMVTTNSIASKHKKLIEKLETLPEQINELMSILKRRNYKHYRNFKLCLEETNQGNVVDVLESGEVFTVGVKLRKNTNLRAIASQLVDVVKFHQTTNVSTNVAILMDFKPLNRYH